ncbi:MAG: Uncharacterised protein [Flavobacterium sp. SCGC AAA160-P02]|nr:MAG: Uncharacterised protein [Flavobacterium sp. SCGC AAA160-P02]
MKKDTKEVFLKSSKAIVVQIVGVAARLLTSIFLGRKLGASGLGDVNLINQIITILIVFTMFGMDHVLVKKISINKSRKEFNLIGQTIFTAFTVNVFIALFLTFTLFFFADYISVFFSSEQLKTPLIISSLVLIPQSISSLFASTINGFNKVWQSRLIKDFSTSIFVFIGLLAINFLNFKINLLNVILIYAISRLLTFVISLLYVRKLYKPIFLIGEIDKSMLKMAKPLLLVSATTLLLSSVDIIMLGWLTDSKNVGLYTVATRLVLFIAFFLQITNSVLSPKIAALYANKKIEEVKSLVRQVTFWLIIIGLLATLFFLLFGEYILGFWGKTFTEAYYCLLILCFGQFINISTGCSGVILIMSGNEKIFSYISAIFLIVSIILNFVFIQLYGIIGAAIATSITIAGENILRVIIVKRRTGILTVPF